MTPADAHHAHAPRSPRSHPQLDPGAGAGGWLFLDCPSGIAGDMVVAALLDLGVPLDAVERALAALPVQGYRLVRGHRHQHGIDASTFEVVVEGAGRGERRHGDIDAMIAAASLDGPVQRLARRIFQRLAEAEADVHGMAVQDVVFHEVGAVDSIVDIVGAAAALVHVGAKVAVSPLPMGRGFVRSRHGTLPVPAPATVHCLRGVPTYGTELDAELVTPTGAAIVSVAAQCFVRWPSFVPQRIGYGAGQRQLEGQPNVLRAVLGRPSEGCSEPAAATHVLVEANVDDLTGELAGHAIAMLLEAGAADAWVTPITMKKGRPGLQLAALAPAALAEAVAETLLRETTSIGLRRVPVSRLERPRDVIEVDTRFGRLPVKVSGGAIEPPQVKPEFDACLAAAREHGVPVRVVLAEVMAAHGRRGMP